MGKCGGSVATNCRLIVIIAALLLTIGCGGAGPVTPPPLVPTAFVFIEQYPAGAAQPFSMTPIIGTFDATGQFVATKVMDPATQQPLSLAIQDASLSPDGKKVVFTLRDEGGFNIYIANADFSEKVKLTHVQQGYSLQPQFTPDGKRIIYVSNPDHLTCRDDQIRVMDLDGSNQQLLHCGGPANVINSVYQVTISPDGRKIAAEVSGFSDVNLAHFLKPYGIAIMKSDGTKYTQLTGSMPRSPNGPDTCPNGDTFQADRTPSFSTDGSKILFSRLCKAKDNSGDYETIYSMNIDGTHPAALLNNGTVGAMDDHPLPLAVPNRIIFSSNRSAPNTVSGFELYSMNNDGTGVTRLTNNNVFDAFTARLLPSHP